MVAGALSSIVWGWAADRLGSRPVLITSLAAGLLVPVGWFILPRQLEAPAIWSGLLYFLYGILSNGAAIGTGRLLFNCVIPPEKSTTYTAIYYAWMGLTGGLAPLLSGWLLTATSSLNIRIAFLTVDGQSVLFVLSFILLSIGWSQYSRVTPDGPFSTRDAWRKLFSIFLAFFREFRLFRG
jgi:MFS family permease